MTAITKSLIYNVEYNIPRVVLGSNVRQNRAIDGKLKLVPGADCPVEFHFGNRDGKALNINNFQVKMLFWQTLRHNITGSPDSFDTAPNDIILSKRMEVQKGYEGQAFVLLTNEDTETLHAKTQSSGGLRWGVFLVNEDNQVFPMVVTSSGGHYADVVFDYHSLPNYEAIISA